MAVYTAMYTTRTRPCTPPRTRPGLHGRVHGRFFVEAVYTGHIHTRPSTRPSVYTTVYTARTPSCTRPYSRHVHCRVTAVYGPCTQAMCTAVYTGRVHTQSCTGRVDGCVCTRPTYTCTRPCTRPCIYTARLHGRVHGPYTEVCTVVYMCTRPWTLPVYTALYTTV